MYPNNDEIFQGNIIRKWFEDRSGQLQQKDLITLITRHEYHRTYLKDNQRGDFQRRIASKPHRVKALRRAKEDPIREEKEGLWCLLCLLLLSDQWCKGPNELTEVPQHDVAWIRLMSEVVVEGFWSSAEVSKFRRVLLEPICSNSGRVGCRIVLLKFPKSVGMHYLHEWVKVIGQNAYAPVKVVSRRIRSPISRQLHTPHTITEPPPA
ncbi:hypothetical protein TNCV_1452811 [Trichonephila clavipes]|nr:hypothetical protein TNCV_1452811 [Trichonephila clavipes]